MSDENLIEPQAKTLTYGSYLKVHEILGLQEVLSEPPQRDETLFILIHQVYELWFKQILHDLRHAMNDLDHDHLQAFNRALTRVHTIQSVLTHQVDILETMTPVDFNRFRERLNPASGFQSYQFRELEFLLGFKDESYLKFYRNDAKARDILEQALASPTLYDCFLRYLKRRGFSIPAEVLDRDVSKPYESSPAVQAQILAIYENSDQHYDLYTTLEKLIDVDEGILLWRYRHVAMVERMIGARKGTGGSSGVKYLAGTLSKRFFPELWEVRSQMGGRPYGNPDLQKL